MGEVFFVVCCVERDSLSTGVVCILVLRACVFVFFRLWSVVYGLVVLHFGTCFDEVWACLLSKTVR